MTLLAVLPSQFYFVSCSIFKKSAGSQRIFQICHLYWVSIDDVTGSNLKTRDNTINSASQRVFVSTCLPQRRCTIAVITINSRSSQGTASSTMGEATPRLYLHNLAQRPQLKNRPLRHVLASFVKALVRKRSSRKKLKRLRVFRPQAFGYRKTVNVGTRAALVCLDDTVEHLHEARRGMRQLARATKILHVGMLVVK